jgi:hypothetical protein
MSNEGIQWVAGRSPCCGASFARYNGWCWQLSAKGALPVLLTIVVLAVWAR